MRIRVITPFGFGLAEAIDEERFNVALDKPFLSRREMELSRKEVFLVSPFGVIRVINASGVGVLSNLQFYSTKAIALEAIATMARPPDETWFLFDLITGEALSSQGMEILTPDFLTMHPWIDRWATEDVMSELRKEYETAKEALEDFEDEKKRMTGANGISSTALFSTRDGKLLGFYITVASPLGVVMEWEGGAVLPSPLVRTMQDKT